MRKKARIREGGPTTYSLTILGREQKGDLHDATSAFGPLAVGHRQQSEGALRREYSLGTSEDTEHPSFIAPRRLL
jgi:hypothetical protein